MHKFGLMVGVLAALAGMAGCSKKTVSPAGYKPNFERGQAVYNRYCGECHDDGENGAPVIDEAADWKNRALALTPVLLDHARSGFLGMPAKAGHEELTDDQIHDAVSYMIREVARAD